MTPDNISIEKELCEEMNVNVNPCDMAQFIKTNGIYSEGNIKDCLYKEVLKKQLNDD